MFGWRFSRQFHASKLCLDRSFALLYFYYIIFSKWKHLKPNDICFRNDTWHSNLNNIETAKECQKRMQTRFVCFYVYLTLGRPNLRLWKRKKKKEKTPVHRPSIQMSDRPTGIFTSSAPVKSKFSFADRLFDLKEAFLSHPFSFDPDVTGVLLKEKKNTPRYSLSHTQSWPLKPSCLSHFTRFSVFFFFLGHVLWHGACRTREEFGKRRERTLWYTLYSASP